MFAALAILFTPVRADTPGKMYPVAVLAPAFSLSFRTPTLSELAQRGFIEGHNLGIRGASRCPGSIAWHGP
jgi:hypothetical protein